MLRAKRLLRHLGWNGALSRRRLATLRLCYERNLLSVARRPRPRHRGRILCYHSIGQSCFGVNDVTPEQFRRHVALALTAGYRFVPASAIALTGGSADELAVTFDDGCKSALTYAAPLLAEYGIPWSLFVVSEWAEQGMGWQIAQCLGWQEIERLARDGVEIGSHSATHPDFSRLTSVRMAEELTDSRRRIEERIGIATTSFAIPFGQSGNWPAAAARAAREAGYTITYAQAEETRPADTVGRSFVTRFDSERIFRALLDGAFDRWEEWY